MLHTIVPHGQTNRDLYKLANSSYRARASEQQNSKKRKHLPTERVVKKVSEVAWAATAPAVGAVEHPPTKWTQRDVNISLGKRSVLRRALLKPTWTTVKSVQGQQHKQTSRESARVAQRAKQPGGSALNNPIGTPEQTQDTQQKQNYRVENPQQRRGQR